MRRSSQVSSVRAWFLVAAKPACSVLGEVAPDSSTRRRFSVRPLTVLSELHPAKSWFPGTSRRLSVFRRSPLQMRACGPPKSSPGLL